MLKINRVLSLIFIVLVISGCGGKSKVLGGIVQFCARVMSAPDAHFGTNGANKWFVCNVYENDKAKSAVRE